MKHFSEFKTDQHFFDYVFNLKNIKKEPEFTRISQKKNRFDDIITAFKTYDFDTPPPKDREELIVRGEKYMSILRYEYGQTRLKITSAAYLFRLIPGPIGYLLNYEQLLDENANELSMAFYDYRRIYKIESIELAFLGWVYKVWCAVIDNKDYKTLLNTSVIPLAKSVMSDTTDVALTQEQQRQKALATCQKLFKAFFNIPAQHNKRLYLFILLGYGIAEMS